MNGVNKMYVVFKCVKCGALNLAKMSQKTRLCPFCGKINQLRVVQILFKTNNLEEANQIIKSMKLPDTADYKQILSKENGATKLLESLFKLKENINENNIPLQKLVNEAKKRGMSQNQIMTALKIMEKKWVNRNY